MTNPTILVLGAGLGGLIAAFEIRHDFVAKVRHGESEPFYEKLALDLIGARKIRAKAPKKEPVA